MDLSFVIRSRAQELGLDQKIGCRCWSYRILHLTVARAQKGSPAPSRTDIYDKMASS